MSNSHRVGGPGRTLRAVVVLSGGRPYTLVLFRSVALVVCLMRKNVTPEFAGAIFGIRVLAEFAPRPGGVVGAGAVLVDGTICPTWEQMDNAGAFLGHLRRCSDQDHVSAVRAAYINGMIGSISPYPGGRQTDLHNDQPGASENFTGEMPWPGKAGGVAVMRPPLRCQRHHTRSSGRVAVLHDPLQSAAPAPP